MQQSRTKCHISHLNAIETGIHDAIAKKLSAWKQRAIPA
jgi:hypothetical protein